MRSLVIVVVVASVASGCLSTDPLDASTVDAATARRSPVIAVIDSGVIPYYAVFAAADPSIVSFVPDGVRSVELAKSGDIKARLKEDAAFWENVEPRVLYHFNGTRILGITFDDSELRRPLLDVTAHGQAVTYFAARDAPSAVIVSIQVSVSPCEEQPCYFAPSVAEAMEWVADQPWIDIVSSSLGFHGNPPSTPTLDPVSARWVQATARAAASGKLIVNAAGNEIVPGLAHDKAGPPWTIAVGGVQSEKSGEATLSSKGVDVVGNYSDIGPRFNSIDEMEWKSGTSFATPLVAATLATAIHDIRLADPGRVVTPAELRAALNASAVYFDASEWDPTPPDRGEPIYDLVGYTNLPILAQPQMGWGYVNATLAGEIARRVLEQDLSIPAEKDQAAAFQPAWQRAREEYWAQDPSP